jgi:hypothetical protein
MAKHFHVDISDGKLAWSRNESAITCEEGLDGIYVIRTSEKKKILSTAESAKAKKENPRNRGWAAGSQLRDAAGTPGQPLPQHAPTGVGERRPHVQQVTEPDAVQTEALRLLQL